MHWGHGCNILEPKHCTSSSWLYGMLKTSFCIVFIRKNTAKKWPKTWIFLILWFRLYMLVRGRKWVSNHKKRVLGTLQGVFEVQNSLSRNFPKILKKSTFCLKIARNPLKKLFLACLTLDFPWEWLEVGCQLMGSPHCLTKLSEDTLGSWLQFIRAQRVSE